MKRAATPTLLELAELFDHRLLEEPNPALQHTVRWLIDRSDAARALDDRMRQKQPGQPSPKDLGELLLAVQSSSYSPAADATLHWLIRQSPVVKERNDRLEQLAHECGIVDSRPNRLSDAVEIEDQLEHWLAVLDKDPEHAIDLQVDGGWDVDIYHLLSLCRARIVRAQGREKQRLAHLRRRFQLAARRAANPRSHEQRLDELLEPLVHRRQVGEALATVDELVARLRSGANSATAGGSREELR